MDDFLSIQKIWQDADFAQYRIACSSQLISASSVFYLTNSLIDDLVYKITQLLNGAIDNCFWANEEKGDTSSACISLHFFRKDRLGHFLIEVYMELDDGGKYSKHNCCFYVGTEYGLLLDFCCKLPKLKEPDFDSTIQLN